ncbi:MarR family transcriptional regulator [Novosphingobium sp. BL-8A]|uniref:MarR family transcriptional regulator n=1 Tax=Novosphingobium sp. BL-8A TaxID=3127639 RepID=UPI0037567FCD
MDEMDFSYGADARDGGATRQGRSATLAIFADRPHLRDMMREDAAAAGMRVTAGALGELRDDGERMLGDVVLVDCPQVDIETIAALARLDLRAFLEGAQLIVSTSVAGLEDVFACMDHSSPILLVDPSRAERVVALGRVMATMPHGRVRELSDDDRLMILRLTEQVGEIAGRIERLAPGAEAEAWGVAVAEPVPAMHPPQSAPPQSAPAQSVPAQSALGKAAPVKAAPGKTTAQLPEARLVRKILRQRELRARFIEGDLFADPAWDMLLDLAAARGEGKQVSVTSLCIAAAVPPTTALRWIGQMVEGGLFRRVLDDNDRRRAFIELTDKAVDSLGRYFGEIGLATAAPV